MLTSFQFAQLAAAAWFGAPVVTQSTASTCQLVGGTTRTSYSVYYTLSSPGGAMFGTAGPFEPCPFQSILTAIDAAWCAGALTGSQVEQAQVVVRAAERVFVGAPTPPPTAPAAVCATCGESADYFGECGCAYVSVPHTHYFRAA
jgi:hypothetical protein